MKNNGFYCIALDNPKSGENVGGSMRAAQIYGASLIVLGGKRPEKLIKHPTDTMKAFKHIPSVLVEDIFEALPFDCIPVAVDLINGAMPLPNYCHPKRAFYIFGAEDATLGKRITDRCRDIVFIPTRSCMNLAATVNVVLYDRLSKLGVAI
jgi:tRNA(Leu) C34 or U34 (ribose-2'-O)-methylase TrmL